MVVVVVVEGSAKRPKAKRFHVGCYVLTDVGMEEMWIGSQRDRFPHVAKRHSVDGMMSTAHFLCADCMNRLYSVLIHEVKSIMLVNTKTECLSTIQHLTSSSACIPS